MNRCSVSVALALFGSPLLAQSSGVIVIQPDQGSAARGTAQSHYYVQQVPPHGGNVRVFEVAPGEVPGPREGEPWLGLSMRSRKDGQERLEVEEVMGGSPAERAGVHVGDKLVALEGRAVATHDTLMAVLREHRSGDRVELTVERTLKARLGETTDDGKQAFLGVTTATQAQAEGRAGGIQGLTLGQVERNSAAAAAGLVIGERIAAVAGVEVNTSEELRTAVRSHQPGEQVELRIQRDLEVELAARPGKGAQGNRAVTGQGLGAFSQPVKPPQDISPGFDVFGRSTQPPSLPAPEGGGQGPHGGQPFSPHMGADPHGNQQPGGFLWQPDPPREAQPGAQAPRSPQLRERAAPALPRTEGPTTPRNQKRAPNRSGQDQIAAELLDELRALRAEVAELRREIESLRQKRR